MSRTSRFTCPIPAFPEVGRKALGSASESTIVDLAYNLQGDGPVSRRVVNAIHLSAFASGQPVATVAGAALEHGRGFRDAALCVLLRDALLVGHRGAGRFDREGFWRHSVGTALAADALASRIPHVDSHHAFVAGLLHDIAFAALDRGCPDVLAKVIGEVEASGHIIIAELYLNGTTHCDFGARIARKWGAEEPVQQAILNHHRPQNAGRDHVVLANVVHLADLIMTPGEVTCYGAAPIDELTLEGLGLTDDDLRDVRSRTSTMLAGLTHLLSLAG